MFLETGSSVTAGHATPDAMLADADAVAAVVSAVAGSDVPITAAAAGMESHRLARVLALHESLVMAHRLEATAKYASGLQEGSSSSSSSGSAHAPSVASAASTAHRNVAADIMGDLLATADAADSARR